MNSLLVFTKSGEDYKLWVFDSLRMGKKKGKIFCLVLLKSMNCVFWIGKNNIVCLKSYFKYTLHFSVLITEKTILKSYFAFKINQPELLISERKTITLHKGKEWRTSQRNQNWIGWNRFKVFYSLNILWYLSRGSMSTTSTQFNVRTLIYLYFKHS